MSDIQQEDFDKINKAVKLFCEGIIECNYKKIYRVFHPEAKSIVVNQKTNELITQTREHWKESHETNNCDPSIESEYKIQRIEYHGTVGFAHVKIVDKIEDKVIIYTDFLSLLKINDNWTIMNKIGYGEQKQR